MRIIMTELKALLLCGSGASSGFMATNIRKAAQRRGIKCSIIARSQTEVDAYIDDVNCIMIGPHMEYILNNIKDKIQGRDIKVDIMKKSYYAILDGDEALNHIISLFE
jgi:cellobiose PTS system EIIB component